MTDTPRPEKKTIRLEDFPKKLLRSFMPAAYPELASEEASASALYLAGVAFLVVLLLVPVLYTMHKRLYERQITATRTYVERAFPEDLYFENGEAHYDGEQPYVHVEEEGNQRYAVIIDTTGQTTAIPGPQLALASVPGSMRHCRTRTPAGSFRSAYTHVLAGV